MKERTHRRRLDDGVDVVARFDRATVDGDQAGNSGNVAVSSNSAATVRSHIDLWMSGPFHAIGLLRPSLQQAAYGMCVSPPNPTNTQWKSAATLDVVRGIRAAERPDAMPVPIAIVTVEEALARREWAVPSDWLLAPFTLSYARTMKLSAKA